MQQKLEQAKFYENMMARMPGDQKQDQSQFDEEELPPPPPQYDLAPNNHNLYKRFREYNPIIFKGGPNPKVVED